jgi:hypothetical protein
MNSKASSDNVEVEDVLADRGIDVRIILKSVGGFRGYSFVLTMRPMAKSSEEGNVSSDSMKWIQLVSFHVN